jgi:vacuolar-type H+-ATPase subunit I/STV1
MNRSSAESTGSVRENKSLCSPQSSGLEDPINNTPAALLSTQDGNKGNDWVEERWAANTAQVDLRLDVPVSPEPPLSEPSNCRLPDLEEIVYTLESELGRCHGELDRLQQEARKHQSAESHRRDEVEKLRLEKLMLAQERDRDRKTIADQQSTIEHLTALNRDTTPFVRDHYGVALRTLVDGVLFDAGWNGFDDRAAFVFRNERQIVRAFGYQFSGREIAAVVV